MRQDKVTHEDYYNANKIYQAHVAEIEKADQAQKVVEESLNTSKGLKLMGYTVAGIDALFSVKWIINGIADIVQENTTAGLLGCALALGWGAISGLYFKKAFKYKKEEAKAKKDLAHVKELRQEAEADFKRAEQNFLEVQDAYLNTEQW